jgi:hypothetical protein
VVVDWLTKIAPKVYTKFVSKDKKGDKTLLVECMNAIYGTMVACEDIPRWKSLCCDSAFAHKKEFSVFKFPKRFSEFSWAKSSLYSTLFTLLNLII